MSPGTSRGTTQRPGCMGGNDRWTVGAPSSGVPVGTTVRPADEGRFDECPMESRTFGRSAKINKTPFA